MIMAQSTSNSNLETNKDGKPSNEELINSLMSDLESAFVSSESVKDTVRSDKKSSDINKETATSECKRTLHTPDDKNKSADEGDEIPTHEDDLIDELALKDLELTYTEQDKERLRKDAEDFKQKGNTLFKSGQYRKSAMAYTEALRTCPLAFSKDRAVFYSNRAASKMKLKLDEAAIEDCTKALELDERYVKTLFRRAQLYEATEKLDEALLDYNKILEVDPIHRDAQYASKRLPEQIQARNEKLKTEMLGKLKDLGNTLLKPFGLSTDNFQMNQDPNSGGYSINFKS